MTTFVKRTVLWSCAALALRVSSFVILIVWPQPLFAFSLTVGASLSD